MHHLSTSLTHNDSFNTMHPLSSSAPLPTHHPPQSGSTQSAVSHALALKILWATLPISSPALSVFWFSSGLSFGVTAVRPPLASQFPISPFDLLTQAQVVSSFVHFSSFTLSPSPSNLSRRVLFSSKEPRPLSSLQPSTQVLSPLFSGHSWETLSWQLK